jgi:amino acid permease
MDDVESKKDLSSVDVQPVVFDQNEESEIRVERETTHRALKSRHISMIAIGGAVGTGLIIGSGTALGRSGPVGLLLGYIVMGAVCFFVMTALGEMCTYLPNKHGFPGYTSERSCFLLFPSFCSRSEPRLVACISSLR